MLLVDDEDGTEIKIMKKMQAMCITASVSAEKKIQEDKIYLAL